MHSIAVSLILQQDNPFCQIFFYNSFKNFVSVNFSGVVRRKNIISIIINTILEKFILFILTYLSNL